MTLALRYSAPERPQATYRLLADRLTVGSLASNHVVVAAPGVEPIHCLIEAEQDGRFRVVDLGSLAGVKVNGHRIEIEAIIAVGDVLEIGAARLDLTNVAPEPARALRAVATEPLGTRDPKRLFRPESKPGRYLEVVAYWGDTILNVEHFHPSIKGMSAVTIGDPTKAHFQSGGHDFFKSSVLAFFDEGDGAVLRLEGDMSARMRVGGQVTAHKGKKRLEFGQRDYAHVQYGAINYFLHFAEPPRVELPVSRSKDKLLNGLLGVGFFAYLAMVLVAVTIKPLPIPVDEDPCALTLCVEPHKIAIDPIKQEREPVRIIELTPPVKPVKATEPPRKKSVQLPETRVKKQATTLALLPNTLRPPTNPNAGGAPERGGPGTQTTKAVAPAPRQGTQQTNVPGVEGGTEKAPSFVDLKKLGTGLSTPSTLPGGITIGANSAPGGRGIGSGTSVRDYGIGGPGGGARLNLPGSNEVKSGWGPGGGSLMEGGLKPGGRGPGIGTGPGSGPGTGPGHRGHNGQVAILMPSIGQQFSSPDNTAGVQRVISQNLNQIRHCYQQLLQRSPQSSGKVRAKFVIAPNGSVTTSAIASSDITDQKFTGCVTSRIARWQFQPLGQTESLTVTFPFIFEPRM